MATKSCTVEGCSGKPHAQGLCNKHYRRLVRTGTTDPRQSKLCSVEGCSNKSRGHDLCSKHYTRQRRYGDTSVAAFIVGDETARFWSKVDVREPSECWEWAPDSRDKAGYGVFYAADGKRTRAHRWLLGTLRGKPLTREVVGLEDACHHCDNPPCCNPDHLYVGTRKQNIGDAVERSRLWQLKVTHCPQGHPYEGDNLIERSDGARGCRACRKAENRRRRTENRTTCKNGHPLSGDNVLLCKNGTRKCRICDAARRAKLGKSYVFVPRKGNQPKQ